MNTQQCLKVTDAVGQILITPTVFFILSLLDSGNGHRQVEQNVVVSYLFGVGAWQATSCLLWAVTSSKRLHGTSRKIYSWLLLILTLWALLGGVVRGMDAANDLGVLLFFVLVILGPVMSIWYFLLTVAEASLPSYKQPQE